MPERSPTSTLTPRQRKHLRGLAHPLKPVVQVGASGITEGVVAALDQALTDHELVKVRMREPDAKHDMASSLAAQTGATLCGLVGHTVILYRQHPTEPRISP